MREPIARSYITELPAQNHLKTGGTAVIGLRSAIFSRYNRRYENSKYRRTDGAANRTLHNSLNGAHQLCNAAISQRNNGSAIRCDRPINLMARTARLRTRYWPRSRRVFSRSRRAQRYQQVCAVSPGTGNGNEHRTGILSTGMRRNSHRKSLCCQGNAIKK